MNEHQLQEIASDPRGRRIGTTLLECLNLCGKFHIIGHHHTTNCGRNCFRVFSAEDSGTAKATNLSPLISSTQGMYTVLDDIQAISARQVKRSIKLHWHTKG